MDEERERPIDELAHVGNYGVPIVRDPAGVLHITHYGQCHIANSKGTF